jgi:carbonic anhydrase
MKQFKLPLIAIFSLLLLVSCEQKEKAETKTETASNTIDEVKVRSILTAEEQAGMTPQEIVGRLKKGNENFINNNLTRRDHSAQRRSSRF